MNLTSPKWIERFLSIASEVAQWSKDSTKVGCVIVSDTGAILSTGYNGFPRGVDDDRPERWERPEKYLWAAHAEENAISNAAMHGVKTGGGIAFVTHHPCPRCAGMLINAGVRRVVVAGGRTVGASPEDLKISMTKFSESNVEYEVLG